SACVCVRVRACVCGYVLLQRCDEEAVLDRGGTRSMLNTNFEKEELEVIELSCVPPVPETEGVFIDMDADPSFVSNGFQLTLWFCLVGHRTLYIGVHVPLGRRSHRRHRHHGHRHRKRSRERDSGTEDGRESPSYTDTPSQRVQFLLGMEDEDEEHIPHALFTELDEICLREGEDAEWKETARWLKFEEDVEDGGERWSKPYVATLSLHSLFELRSCILNGSVMLDMRATSLEEIADMVLDQHGTSVAVGDEVRKKIRDALLKQHHHQNQKKLANRIPIVRSFADIGRKQSEPHSMDKNGNAPPPLARNPHTHVLFGVCACDVLNLSLVSCVLSLWSGVCCSQVSQCPLSHSPPAQRPEMKSSRENSTVDFSKIDLHFMKKIPPGAEASNILVGELEFLEKPVVAFVRLSPAVLLNGLAEVPITTRDCPSKLPAVQQRNERRHPSPRRHPPPLLSLTISIRGDQVSGSYHLPRSEQGDVDSILEKPQQRILQQLRKFGVSQELRAQVHTAVTKPITVGFRAARIRTDGSGQFLFILLGPLGKGPQYHEIGRSIATLMTDEVFHDVAYKAKDRSDLVAGIDEFLDQVTVLPPGEWDPTIRIEPPKNVPSQYAFSCLGLLYHVFCIFMAVTSLASTAPWILPNVLLVMVLKFFGGLILDVKRKAPHYLSDYTDAVSLQCLASFLFLYCACMSPVITFGGLLGEATEGRISAIESLFGASMTGIAYSLFAGQPLTILGSTGPVLVFEKILFKFCKEYGLSYLSLRVCIGLWTAFLCILLVATDASSLVCYITRFTEEAFASLICIIFIYEALEKLVHLGETYPFNMHKRPQQAHTLHLYFPVSCVCTEPTDPSNATLRYWEEHNITSSEINWLGLDVKDCVKHRGEFQGSACGHHGPYIPDVLFWSVVLFFSTVAMSSFLKEFKTSRYFPTKASLCGGVGCVRAVISDFAVFITIVTMVAIDYALGVPSPKLQVPNQFKPTRDDRGWIISPLGPNPWWTVIIAFIPALLCTILIFMDQQITAVIINRKEHKLKKGCGYHLDLFMVSVMLGVCSVMGLPWFVAATVLSISHVNSLKLESECSAPGEQPKFLGIREQRFTGLMIFVLMGSSVFMTSILKFIPMPVLYGVFLYMGSSSLRGIQFFDRVKLFGMPAKHQPDFIYLRHVPLRKVHLFTIIQLSCLVLLWVIKTSRAAIVFPMMVLALVFIRKLLDFIFTKRELSWLDDLMPESKKKKLEDAQKESQSVMVEDEGIVHVPLEGNFRDDPSTVNISDEMTKTSFGNVWKSLNKDNGKKDKIAKRADVSEDAHF
ncbi:hypothetical protein P4O66_012789, partial [Electrophorus voltai]